MEETLDLNTNDRNNTFNMHFLNNKRSPAAKPERRLAAGLRPFNSQRHTFPRSPLKRLCKFLLINSVKPSQIQSNHACYWSGDSLSPQFPPARHPPTSTKTSAIPFVIRHSPASPLAPNPQYKSKPVKPSQTMDLPHCHIARVVPFV